MPKPNMFENVTNPEQALENATLLLFADSIGVISLSTRETQDAKVIVQKHATVVRHKCAKNLVTAARARLASAPDEELEEAFKEVLEEKELSKRILGQPPIDISKIP